MPETYEPSNVMDAEILATIKETAEANALNVVKRDILPRIVPFNLLQKTTELSSRRWERVSGKSSTIQDSGTRRYTKRTLRTDGRGRRCGAKCGY